MPRNKKEEKVVGSGRAKKAEAVKSVGRSVGGCTELNVVVSLFFFCFFSERIRKGGMAEGDAKGDEGRG